MLSSHFADDENDSFIDRDNPSTLPTYTTYSPLNTPQPHQQHLAYTPSQLVPTHQPHAAARPLPPQHNVGPQFQQHAPQMGQHMKQEQQQFRGPQGQSQFDPSMPNNFYDAEALGIRVPQHRSHPLRRGEMPAAFESEPQFDQRSMCRGRPHPGPPAAMLQPAPSGHHGPPTAQGHPIIQGPSVINPGAYGQDARMNRFPGEY